MRKNRKNNSLGNLLLALMLIAAMAFVTAGCGDEKEQSAETPAAQQVSDKDTGTEQKEPEASEAQPSETEEKGNVLGEGKTSISFVVVDGDGNETSYEIHTDKETVGDALLEHDLIAGDTGDYGLYVKQVTGITADFDVDKTYWAFYINGEYASTGVDATPVKEGETYSFKIEK